MELVAVVDESEASRSAFGCWIAGCATRAGRPISWCVRPDDLAATAGRLELRIEEGSRTKPSGERVEWRTAGIGEAASSPGLPFFIEWRDPAAFPGATESPAATIARVEIACNLTRLSAWLGTHELPIDVKPGDAGITGVVLEGPRGPIELSAEPSL